MVITPHGGFPTGHAPPLGDMIPSIKMIEIDCKTGEIKDELDLPEIKESLVSHYARINGIVVN